MKQSLQRTGFTLIELLAVIAVIMVLMGLAIGFSGYVQKRAASHTAKGSIARIEVALDQYKLDVGAYPLSGAFRVSRYGNVETENSAALYRALAGGNKKYITFSASQLQRAAITNRTHLRIGWGWADDLGTDVVLPVTTGGITNHIILDPWGKPINYYCRPANTPNTITNYPASAAGGGQVNLLTFDLMSYGPDMATFAPQLNAINAGYPGAGGGPFSLTNSANDDITNFRP